MNVCNAYDEDRRFWGVVGGSRQQQDVAGVYCVSTLARRL